MPYSGPDDKDLPSNVKKLSKKKRQQWVSTFNSTYTEKDESSAFAIANAAVKTKGWIGDVWEVETRQISMDDAEYKPLGATDTDGCAACNWFVSPDACVLVFGDISPTGICKMVMQRPKYEPEPMPVVIVKQNESLLARVKSWLRGDVPFSLEELPASKDDIKIDSAAPHGPVQGDRMLFYKTEDGTYRFFTAFTNSYEDKHGETLTALSHKDYVEWVNESGLYPDLRIWHCGSDSRIGKVDCIDFIDGFVTASGTIDKSKEYIADTLQSQEIATSHGFVGLITKSGEVLRYRTFEISVLPSWAAANLGTNFSIKGIGEKEMPFSEAKKVWLKEVAKVDDATIVAWEKSVEELGSKFKELGLEYKEGNETDVVSEIQNVNKAIGDLAGVVKAQQVTIEQLSKSQDDKIAEVFKAEVAKLPQGFRASEADTTVVSKEKASEDVSWFESIVKGVTA